MVKINGLLVHSKQVVQWVTSYVLFDFFYKAKQDSLWYCMALVDDELERIIRWNCCRIMHFLIFSLREFAYVPASISSSNVNVIYLQSLGWRWSLLWILNPYKCKGLVTDLKESMPRARPWSESPAIIWTLRPLVTENSPLTSEDELNTNWWDLCVLLCPLIFSTIVKAKAYYKHDH